jgi:hypothetical protein
MAGAVWGRGTGSPVTLEGAPQMVPRRRRLAGQSSASGGAAGGEAAGRLGTKKGPSILRENSAPWVSAYQDSYWAAALALSKQLLQ